MRIQLWSPLMMALALCACGDKLDPGDGSDTAATTSATGTGSDGNTTVGNANSTAGNGNTTSSGTGLCGTSSTSITYNGQAALVINNRCAICHSSATRGQSPDLSNYANAKSGISGQGLSQIKSGSMPPAGSTALSTNEQCIINTWASQGYRN